MKNYLILIKYKIQHRFLEKVKFMLKKLSGKINFIKCSKFNTNKMNISSIN
jgi:hypothetical protein